MKPQHHWDVRAALNFILGGTGAGLIVAAAFVPKPSLALAVGLAMIGAGLFAVWLETGRKLRALHVLFNPKTSWMTREAFVALVLFPLALGSILTGKFVFGAMIAAAAFLYCQAKILRAARGIPAWRAPEVVPLIVTTGLAEGAGLCLFFSSGAASIGLFVLFLIARAFAWSRYRAAVKNLALAPLMQLGTAAALVFAAAGFYIDQLTLPAAVLAVATGWWLKFALVTRAGFEGFTLPRIPVRGTR